MLRLPSCSPAAMAAVAVALSCGAMICGAAPGNGQTSSPPRPALRLPPDIVYERAAGSDRAVVFRHGTHVAFAGDKCLGCHPAPFRMLRPTRRITHEVMDRGGSCGVCHDGRKAFAVRDSAACQTCHAGRPAPPDLAAAGRKADAGATAAKLPGTIRFPRGDASPGPVRFRHDTHTKDGCAACHPKRFAMKATGARKGGAMHEANACGGCHDGGKAFGVESAEACARCHAEGKP